MIDIDLTFAVTAAASLIGAIACVRAVHSRENHKRIMELAEARLHLERYFATVEDLLACEPSEQLVDLLGQLNFVFNDRNAIAFFEKLHQKHERLFAVPIPQSRSVEVTAENFHTHQLFVQAAVEVIMAFGKRHPHLAYLWDDGLPTFVASPAASTNAMAHRVRTETTGAVGFGLTANPIFSP